MKKHFYLLSLTALAALASCSPAVTSSSESTPPSSASSQEIIHTENLTDAMLESLKGGYEAEVFKRTNYDGETSSYQAYDVKCNETNYAVKIYSTSKEPEDKSSLLYDNHYQPNPEEKTLMLYNAGLSVGNTVMYTPVMGQDPFTYEEVEMTWEDGLYSNAFASLTAKDFVRVNSENKFSLKLTDATLESNYVYAKLANQFFGEIKAEELSFFNLLTNGNTITGYEMEFKPYSSYDSMVGKSSYGNFIALGANVVDYVKPISGETDALFEETIAKLKNYNYSMTQEQQAFDYTTEKFYKTGGFSYKVENGTKLLADYYNASDERYMKYGYYDTIFENEPCKQSVVEIEGNFYKDYIYTEHLSSYLPSFSLSSVLFKKSEQSTADKAIYELNKDIRISLENNMSVFTPFDTDSYYDRLVYLTITIEKDTVTFKNETTRSSSGGLILDCVFSDIGKINNLIPDDKVFETCDGLKWSQLLSPNEANLKRILKTYPAAVLDEIPTLGGNYSNVLSDLSSGQTRPVFYIGTYDLEETTGLLDEYGKKLELAGYSTTLDTDGKPTYVYTKIVQINAKNYTLNITLGTFWNALQEWGQFQIALSLTSAK